MSSSKVCFKCNQEKPLDDFYKHPMMADGHVGKCKECNKKDVRENRAAKIEYYRSYDSERAKRPERMKLLYEVSKAWRKADSRRMKCHNAVARGIRKGTITRKPCQRCGSMKSLAHHESYDRPLDVTWLCQPCHKERHKEMKILDSGGNMGTHSSVRTGQALTKQETDNERKRLLQTSRLPDNPTLSMQQLRRRNRASILLWGW